MLNINPSRVLTGIRPTGPLHLGHYVGALKQWIPLQSEYECFFLIADWQALTTHADNPKLIHQSVIEVLLDFIAVGLDPHKRNVHFVLQSWLPELNQLYTLLSMVTPKGWIDQNPTIKSELKTLRTQATLGFFDYPVSQAADILIVSPDPNESRKHILVPVGEDQVPHLEATNRIVRRFHTQYQHKVFAECEPIIGDIGRLVGLDGQEKMSKSQGNAIDLKDPMDVVQKKVMSMFTDPKRIRADIPGTVEGNPVFIYMDAFATAKDQKEVEQLKSRYRLGTVGDVEVKQVLFRILKEFLTPIQNRRKFAEEHEDIGKILRSGTNRAKLLASATIQRGLTAAGMDYSDLKK